MKRMPKSIKKFDSGALKTDPEAFGYTYEREVEFSFEQVASRINPTKDRFVLGALHNGELAGIVTFMRESGLKRVIKETFLECMLSLTLERSPSGRHY